MGLTQVSTKGIKDGTILNEDISNSAAIAASKVSGLSSDSITEGNSKVEVVDSGTGYVTTEIDGTEVSRANAGGSTIFTSAIFGANTNKATGTGQGISLLYGGGTSNVGLISCTHTSGLRLQNNAAISLQQNGSPNNVYAIFDNGGCEFNINGVNKVDLEASGFTVKTHILSGTDSTHDIGTNTNRFANIYADTLYGDGSNLTGISAGTALSGSTNNTICTVTGANAIQGEANLTFDGLRLGINRTPTANADYPLQIKSANATAFAHFRSSQSAGDDPNTDGGLVGILNDDMYLWGRESGSRIILGTNNSEKVRITDGGNVGIGITNPNKLLTIQNTADVDYDISTGTTNSALLIKLNAATGTDKCVGISFNGPNANGEGYITMVGSSSTEAEMRFGMRSGGSRGDRVIFQPNGRVRMPGVYGTAGSSMRDVQIESDGTLCGLSSITAAKTNITDLTDVSWLYNLKPKTFNFRKKTSDVVTGVNTYSDEAETEKAYGLLAEDVETVNKDFCFYDKDSEGNDVLAGVYYKTMVVPLLKAVQELKAENTALTTRVAALEAA